MMQVIWISIMCLGFLVHATLQNCNIINYMAMHQEFIESADLTESVYYFPSQNSSKRVVFTLCRDLDKSTKAKCGIGSEKNLTLVVFDEDRCINFKEMGDLITSNSYYDNERMKNLDLVYSKDPSTNHFYMINFRKAKHAKDTSITSKSNYYSVWFRHSYLSSTTLSIPVADTPFKSTNMNLVSHTYLSRYDFIISIVIHTLSMACMLCHNTHTTATVLRDARPFGVYVCMYVALRITGWIDSGMFSVLLAYPKLRYAVNASYFGFAALSIYNFEYNLGKSFVNKWIVPLYVLICLVDYTIFLLFLSFGVASVGLAYFLLMTGMPRLTTSLIKDEAEWIISFGFSLEFFMQHILWVPFKKLGAAKLFMAGLEPYFVTQSFLFFTGCMIGGVFPVALLRYKVSMYRTKAFNKATDKVSVFSSGIDSQLTDD